MSGIRRRPGALVTGASSGIGYELTRILAREGHDLALVARTEGVLERLAADVRTDFGVRVEIVAADLADAKSPDIIWERLRSLGFRVDVLVNNAGFGSLGSFAASDTGTQLDMVQVNVAAVAHLTRLVLPDMLERGEGRILNVASTAAFQPGPGMAVYFATKAFVLSFSEALAEELYDAGVTVTALCPGPTPTGFQKRASMEKAPLGGRLVMGDPAAVARAGYGGMVEGKRIVVPGIMNRIGAFLPRIVPRRVTTSVVRRLTRARRDR
jgi:short-subunit dehydrogenase